jgi:uncharacterized membrane protein YphA (DoxX/SURF4 family)
MPLSNLVVAWLPIALGVVMIAAGLVNFVGPGSVRASFDRWGYPRGFHRVAGGLEMAGGALMLVPATARVGAIGIAMILAAAVATLVWHRDWSHLPGALLLTGVAVFVAAFSG